MFLRIFLPGIEESVFKNLKSILEKHEGECPVFFELETPHSCRMIVQSVDIDGVAPSEELSRNIEDLLGEQTVFIEY